MTPETEAALIERLDLIVYLLELIESDVGTPPDTCDLTQLESDVADILAIVKPQRETK